MSGAFGPHRGAEDPAEVPTRQFLLDGAALSASALLTASVGLVGWLIAARLQPPEVVGVATAFVNSFMLVAAVAEIGLGPAMLRWLPRAGAKAPTLVLRTYAASLSAAVVLAVLWRLVFEEPVDDATGALWAGSVLFVVACAAWVVFHLQDEVLTGLGAARWVPVENLVFAAARIGLLLALASSLDAWGILLSWVLPTVAIVLVVNVCLAVTARRRADRRTEAAPGRLPTRREVRALLGPTYPAAIATAVMYNVVPLSVVTRSGAELGAVFFVVWMGLNALDVAGTGIGNALVVRLSTTREDGVHLLARAGARVLPVVAGALVVPFLVAEPLLALFGPEYADAGTTVLRWVVVGFLGRMVVLLVAAIHLGAGRGVRMALLQGVNAVAMIAMVWLVPATGLAVVGAAFAGLQLAIAALAVLDLARLR